MSHGKGGDMADQDVATHDDMAWVDGNAIEVDIDNPINPDQIIQES